MAFISHANHSAPEDSVVTKSANQLLNTLPEGKDGELEIKKENQADVSESVASWISRRINDSESYMELKKNFEDLKKFSQELDSNLKREREKTKTLEDALETLEMEKRREIVMYRELEEECDHLWKELEDIDCSQSKVPHREIRLNTQEEKTDILRKQVNSPKEEVQSSKEERDSGNGMCNNLTEKNTNLLKEKKHLKVENLEQDQKEKKLQELEESLQARILELIDMKNENEAARDNLLALERAKKEGDKNFASLENDYVKLVSDCKELQRQVDEERHRGETLTAERALLQKKVVEMQNDLKQRDLVAAVNKKTVEMYALENKALKDEKGDHLKESERLKEEQSEQLEDLKELKTIKEEMNSLVRERDCLLKEAELSKKENKALLEHCEELKDTRIQLKCLKDERMSYLTEIEAFKKELEELKTAREDVYALKHEKEFALENIQKLKEENKSLVSEHGKLSRIIEDLNYSLKCDKEDALTEKQKLKEENEYYLKKLQELEEGLTLLQCEKERALEETRKLKQENEFVVRELEGLKITKGDFAVLNCEQSPEDVCKLKLEKDALIGNLKELERTPIEGLSVHRCEKQDVLKEKQQFNEENEALVIEIEAPSKANKNFHTRLVSSSEEMTLKEKCKELEGSLEKQVLEVMKLKKESTTWKNKVGILTKEIQRLQEETRPRDLEVRTFPESEKGKKYKAMDFDVKIYKEEIEFLQNEVEDLTEEKVQLLQAYNLLKGEMVGLKKELSFVEKCLEAKSIDLKSSIEERNLEEKRRRVLEDELKFVSAENEKIRTDVGNVTRDFDSLKQRLASALQEIQDTTTGSEETHIEEKYNRIRIINRELEEDIEIEIGKLAEANARNKELCKENTDLQGLLKISDLEQAELEKKVQRLEKKKAKYKTSKKELEIQLADEKSRNEHFDAKKKKLENFIGRLKDEMKNKESEFERTVSALEVELNKLRPLEERVNALGKETGQLREKLNLEIGRKNSKAEEVELKKKENDSLKYELESIRHRLVSNVVNPLEGACNVRVNVADIYAGKPKAWSYMKESIVALIRDRENLKTANSSLEHAWSGKTEQNQAAKAAWNHVAADGTENLQVNMKTSSSQITIRFYRH